MKKIVLFMISMLSQLAALQAFEVEARVAYFYPSDSRLREVYGKNGWADYQIEASMPIKLGCECTPCWDVWFNADYYQKRGHSTCLKNKTKVENWAFNFGLRRYFDMCNCLRPYIGLGGGFANVRFHDRIFHNPFALNETVFLRRKIDKCGGSLLIKSGVKYDISCNFFVDLFLDYGFNWFSGKNKHHGRKHENHGAKTRSIDTGGLKTGLGLGVRF